MPLKIQITDNSNLKGLSGEIRNRVRNALQAELPKLAKEIVDRTQSGQSIEGGSFKPYTAAYEQAKRRALGSASPVNLTVTGEMLASIRAKTSGGLTGAVEASIEITDPKAEFHQPTRPFFGLSRTQIAKLVRAISGAILRR